MVAVLVGAVTALAFGGGATSLVRDRLHISCAMGEPLGEGADTWMCADGIGYVGVAVTLGAMWFLATVAGALTAGFVRSPRAAQLALLTLAIASAAWILGWTWYGSSELVGDEFAPQPGPAYWADAVGPAALITAVSLAVAAVGAAVDGRVARLLPAVGAAGLVVATCVQPGLAIDLLAAAGLLVAAALRGADVSVGGRIPHAAQGR